MSNLNPFMLETELEVVFLTAYRERLKFRFELFDTPLTKHWLKLLIEDLNQKLPLLEKGIIYRNDIEPNIVLLSELNQVLMELEKLKPGYFLKYLNVKYDQKILFELHDLKEDIEREAEKIRVNSDILRIRLYQLNVLIHRFELALDKNQPFFKCVLIPTPPKREFLNEIDLNFFSVDNLFGHLYLDYATNGIPVIESFFKKHANPPVPQKEISSGFNISFSPDFIFKEWKELRTWVEENNMDFNKNLAIGNGLLGRLKLEFFEDPDLMDKIKCIDSIDTFALQSPKLID